MSLLDLYDLSLRGHRDAPAIEIDDLSLGTRTLSFGELDARSDRLALLLATRGLARGDRIGFCLPNRVEIIDLWLASMKLALIVVPINVLYKGREIGHIVGDSKPKAVVTTAERVADFPAGTTCWDVDQLGREAATHDTSAEDALAGEASPGRAPRIAVRCDPTTPAALVYTSGTTGVAKGAILTHGNFAANALALTTIWGITSADRYLAALPLFHVHGLGNGIQCWLASGCQMKLVERFDQEKALGWFETFRATLFFGVPTMYVRLLEAPPDRARAIGAAMRLFVSGSAPLPVHVHNAFAERFGHVILERYGMTETLMNVSNPLVGERRAGTVGLPLPLVTVQIRDEEGALLPDGELGELWVQGPNVCAGYWEWPEATSQAFKNGWFRTGDIGVRARDGYITLHGRRSDLIISAGFNIYPREIEELLLTQPGVHEAAVVGETDSVRGEIPIAYLVCDAEPDAAALEAALRAQIASFKIPRTFVRVDALPRTALGKVQKHLLPALKR